MSLTGYKELFYGMFRTGILGYGGGPSVIPLIRHEAVNRYKWINDEEFGEILALANALPGPIATKMAAYLGYRVKGSSGALVAVLAHIFPTSIAMVLFFGLLDFFRSSKVVEGMINAVDPVIAVMLGLMAYEFAQKAWKGLGKFLTIGFLLLVFLLLAVFHVHSALVIILFLAYGSVHFRLMDQIQKRKQEGGAR
ncbi:chromate transporter [Effusibacillus dendaii]|uniref:Putative transporter YwrB n=1 Tax=Effusibacillus dendaii TaxID=2743772 RepID=A0A7I8DGB2_9BACL|nr:chromate transporter [Effusibacillus dendaii]BCJ87999.1 putative transporter YwrB [Effusibacillus dendaii]